ncbi:MAG: hypothetical protein ABIA92_02460 [Patescibacteria group bacterium]
MKKFFHLSLGILALSALFIPDGASAGIYGWARALTNFEYKGIDGPISGFITHKQVFNRSDTDPFSGADVNDAMEYSTDNICRRRRDIKGALSCDAIAQPVRDIARREELVRTLERDLQAIALGYELPITDHSIEPMSLAPRMPSIIRIWQSSSDWIYSPVTERRVRSQSFPTKEEDPVLYDLVMGKKDGDGNIIKPGIKQLAGEGMARRYRWGLFTVKREDPQLENCSKWYECKDWLSCWEKQDNDTELKPLFVRGCSTIPEASLEDMLQKVLDHLHATIVFDPPLQNGEIVIFPPWELNEDTFMWVHMNYARKRDDIGLGDKLPLEPMMLKLDCDWENDEYGTPACVPGIVGDTCLSGGDPDTCKKGIILGGMYLDPPREPPMTEKVCTMPFSSHGYLCKEIDQMRCPPQEPEEGEKAPSDEGIVLTRCDPDNLTGVTWQMESGPDACRIGGWRFNPVGYKNDEGIIEPVKDTPKRDKEINRPFNCSNCAVDLFCSGQGGTCVGGAYTLSKNDNDVFGICLPETTPINSYFLLHELVHAQQFCNLPPEAMREMTSTPERCCAVEQPAYFTQCAAVAEDGHFEDTDLTVEVCTSAFANLSCLKSMSPGSGGLPCTGNYYTIDELIDITKRVNKAADKNLAGLPETCEDVINYMDPRAKMFINSLPLVCSAECQSEYQNTIGNNACYIAQCTEESLETQRLYPGRMNFVTQDEAFPWESDIKPDPLIGSVMPIPPLPLTRFPSYRPELFVKDLDLALCQLAGLPISQPPHRCAFHALRQLALLPSNPSLLGYGFVTQTSEGQEEAWGLQSLAPSIGVRLGTDLYIQYFRRAGKAFWELVRGANELIGGIATLEFPADSCPRYNPQ